MKRFTFRLQHLLHLRESLEKMQGASLGHADRETGERRITAEESISQLGTAQDQVHETANDPVAAGMWHTLGLSVEAARIRAELDARDLREAEAARAVELDRFNEARAARRVLEKLRERREADWTVESGREERREHDEITRSRIVDQANKQ
jgi:flagellar export protein FliJ